MDLLQGEPGSCDDSCGTCTLDEKKLTSIEAERVSHLTNEEDQEPATIPAIKTEPNVSFCLWCVLHTFIICCKQILGAPLSRVPLWNKNLTLVN